MRPSLSVPTLLWILHSAAFAADPQTAPAAPKEVLESADADTSKAAPAPASTSANPKAGAEAKDASNMADTAGQAAPPVAAEPVPVAPLSIRSPFLEKLDLGGTVQVKGLYRNMTADRDADKRLSLTLRRLKLDLNGSVDSHFGFKAGFQMDGNNKNFSVDDGYLYYTLNDLVGFKAGKLKRPFSQEALQSSSSLYTIERGELYHNFLANTTGYAYYDVGLEAYGGFIDEGRSVGYEIGLFNGKQNDNVNGDYAGQQNETLDQGFKAKDLVMRVTATPFRALQLEAAVSTKAAEDTSNPNEFKYDVNTGYEIGFTWILHKLRLLGEVSWGDNQNKRDSRIIDGSSSYFAFYGMGVWREEYKRGRASELVLKLEGLDPDTDFEWSKGTGKRNDGLLRYTAGTNFFFTPRVSLMADYGILQPITEVVGQKDLTQNLDVMWRLSF